LLQSGPAFGKSQFLALWSDTWHEFMRTNNWYVVLEPLLEPVELSIISVTTAYPQIGKAEDLIIGMRVARLYLRII
jgi:hypothetical protein